MQFRRPDLNSNDVSNRIRSHRPKLHSDGLSRRCCARLHACARNTRLWACARLRAYHMPPSCAPTAACAGTARFPAGRCTAWPRLLRAARGAAPVMAWRAAALAAWRAPAPRQYRAWAHSAGILANSARRKAPSAAKKQLDAADVVGYGVSRRSDPPLHAGLGQAPLLLLVRVSNPGDGQLSSSEPHFHAHVQPRRGGAVMRHADSTAARMLLIRQRAPPWWPRDAASSRVLRVPQRHAR